MCFVCPTQKVPAGRCASTNNPPPPFYPNFDVIVVAVFPDGSNWYKGYPSCGLDSQSPINLNAAVETVVKVSAMRYTIRCAA